MSSQTDHPLQRHHHLIVNNKNDCGFLKRAIGLKFCFSCHWANSRSFQSYFMISRLVAACRLSVMSTSYYLQSHVVRRGLTLVLWAKINLFNQQNRSSVILDPFSEKVGFKLLLLTKVLLLTKLNQAGLTLLLQDNTQSPSNHHL